jgi:hypothetical protein
MISVKNLEQTCYNKKKKTLFQSYILIKWSW